jgi:tetratricopeptide (TPR) repeat protein
MRSYQLKWALVALLVDVSFAAANPVALFEAGKFDQAKKAFSERLLEQPGDAAALYYLGKLNSDGAKSAQLFERVLAEHQRSEYADKARFELAELVFSGPYGRYVRARGMYRAFLVAHPESVLGAKARYRIGQTFLITNDADSALIVFNDLMADQTESNLMPYVRLGVAEAKAMAGKTHEALRESKLLLGASPVSGLAATLRQSLGGTLNKQESGGGNGEMGYWVRVGVFGNPENIRSLTGRLETAGYVVTDSAMAIRGLRMVLAGPFPDSVGAETARLAIEQLEGLKCQVFEQKNKE